MEKVQNSEHKSIERNKIKKTEIEEKKIKNEVKIEKIVVEKFNSFRTKFIESEDFQFEVSEKIIDQLKQKFTSTENFVRKKLILFELVTLNFKHFEPG